MPSDVKKTKEFQKCDMRAEFDARRGSLLYAMWYVNKYSQKHLPRGHVDEFHIEIMRRLRSIEVMDPESMDEEPIECVD